MWPKGAKARTAHRQEACYGCATHALLRSLPQAYPRKACIHPTHTPPLSPPLLTNTQYLCEDDVAVCVTVKHDALWRTAHCAGHLLHLFKHALDLVRVQVCACV